MPRRPTKIAEKNPATARATSVLEMDLADVKQHWLKAATYDIACARRADRLLSWDNWVMNSVLVMTTVSSLGIFGSLVADNPATWAKVTVFVLTSLAAVLTAVRQQNTWAQKAKALREKGEAWAEERATLGDEVWSVLHGGGLSERQRLDANLHGARLLKDQSALSTRKMNRAKRDARAEFEEIYEAHRPPAGGEAAA